MFNPVEGYVSSHFRTSSRPNHDGTDIACKANAPVYAAFAGTVSVVVNGRVHDRTYNQVRNAGKPMLATGRTGNGVRVQNPDNEEQLYGHIRPVVSRGQKVAKGQLLGYVDLSGNTSGYHLHFETWNARKAPYNPMLAFNNHKIKPGVAMKPAAVVKPSATTSTSKSKLPSNLTIQKRLTKMGLYKGSHDGVNGNMQKAAVKAYQRANNLVADGVWGSKTESRYQSICKWQRSLNGMRRGTVAVDGHAPSGGATRKLAAYIKKRNGISPANGNFTTDLKNLLIKVGVFK